MCEPEGSNALPPVRLGALLVCFAYGVQRRTGSRGERAGEFRLAGTRRAVDQHVHAGCTFRQCTSDEADEKVSVGDMGEVGECQRGVLPSPDKRVEHLLVTGRRTVEQPVERPADIDFDLAAPAVNEAGKMEAYRQTASHRTIRFMRRGAGEFAQQKWQVMSVTSGNVRQRLEPRQTIARDHQSQQRSIERRQRQQVGNRVREIEHLCPCGWCTRRRDTAEELLPAQIAFVCRDKPFGMRLRPVQYCSGQRCRRGHASG